MFLSYNGKFSNKQQRKQGRRLWAEAHEGNGDNVGAIALLTHSSNGVSTHTSTIFRQG